MSMVDEKYPCYINIIDEVTSESCELPSETDGTISLATVQSQFPGAIGLRFKGPTDYWRGVSLNDSEIFDVPLAGWGGTAYQVVMPDRPSIYNTPRTTSGAAKRKLDTSDSGNPDEENEDLSPLEKIAKMSDEEILQDIVVLNIPYEMTEDDIKAHFEKEYGEVTRCYLRKDSEGKSCGCCFLRFTAVEAVKKVFSDNILFNGRSVDVFFTKTQLSRVPAKVFCGKMPPGVTEDEMKEYFSKFGEVKGVNIPQPYKGYGFVTFHKKSAVKKVLTEGPHELKGTEIVTSLPRNQEDKGQGKAKQNQAPPAMGNTTNQQILNVLAPLLGLGANGLGEPWANSNNNNSNSMGGGMGGNMGGGAFGGRAGRGAALPIAPNRGFNVVQTKPVEANGWRP